MTQESNMKAMQSFQQETQAFLTTTEEACVNTLPFG